MLLWQDAKEPACLWSSNKCQSQEVNNQVPNAHVGDGICNAETNNADCNYDGGDCCDDIAELEDGSCRIIESCILGTVPLFVGDGFCNDETNVIECQYDGLDCGQCDNPYDVDNTFCSDCKCHLVEGKFWFKLRLNSIYGTSYT